MQPRSLLLSLLPLVLQYQASAQIISACEPYTNTVDGLSAMGLHYEFLTVLKNVTKSPTEDDFDYFTATEIANHQRVTFNATIPRKAAGAVNVTMTNGLEGGQGRQNNAGFRYQIVLRSFLDPGTPQPDFLVDAGYNCQVKPDVAKFVAEDVIGVIVHQLWPGPLPQS